MNRYTHTDEFRGAEFVELDLSGAVFREVDLSGARMYGVLLTGADIDGAIGGLRINGVDVAPLIEAELDRQYPERTKLRPTTPVGMRTAWAVIETLWTDTMQRALTRPSADLERSVGGEWSFAQTLRHLIFVTDAWLGHAVLGDRQPFHRLALPASFITDGEAHGMDTGAAPSFAEVAQVRADRIATVRRFLDGITQEELDRVREPNTSPGWPSPASRTATACLQVILNEEWAHHRFAVRDLAVIEAGHSFRSVDEAPRSTQP